MEMKVKRGSDLTPVEKTGLGRVLRKFDTFAPVPDDQNKLSFEALFKGSDDRPPGFHYFDLAATNYYFMVCDDNDVCWASATLIMAASSRKSQVTVEDIIVDDSYRERGIGNYLMREVIKWAKERRHIHFIQLTSSPERGWVNDWFVRLGFTLVAGSVEGVTDEEYSTNLFRMKLIY
jgi:GNAT superfamily N-acetyltransferase